MAIVGLFSKQDNPIYTKEQFLIYFPQFLNVLEDDIFNEFLEIANSKVNIGVWGADWKLGMGLCVAHYLELRARNLRIPQAHDISNLAGGGNYQGVVASYTVGEYSKSIDLNSSISQDKDALFWNSTSYGAQFWNLWKTKPMLSMFVVNGY